MDSYSSSYHFYPSSPSMPCIYSNFNTPSPSYCNCCYSPTLYYHQHHQPPPPPALVYSPPSPSPPRPPFYPQNNQVRLEYPLTHAITPPSIVTEPIPTPQSSSKITRLQYSNKDRYILNELFKRTPYPNAIQRDVIARQLGITQEQIRIWFQNRRRLQTQRDSGERLTTTNELLALQQGKASINSHDLKKLINDVTHYKDAPPRLRLDESS